MKIRLILSSEPLLFVNERLRMSECIEQEARHG